MSKLLLIFICLILIIFGLFFILIRNKLSYIGAFLCALSASIPDLYYVPKYDADLSRYFLEMKFVSNFDNIKSLLYSYKYMNNFNYHAGEPIYNIFQWMIARTGYYNLLPFFSVLIVYSCILMPFIHHYNKYKNVSLLNFIIGFLSIAVLIPYSGISSTVRWCLASGLFFAITYCYFSAKKKYRFIYLILYFILIFIHEAMIFPLLVMIICTFIRYIRKKYCVIFACAFLLIFTIIQHVSFLSKNSIFSITQKYSKTSASQFLGNGSSKVNFVTLLLVPALFSVGDYLLIKENKQFKVINSEVNLFVLFNLFEVLLLPDMIIAQRYSSFVGMVDVILLIFAKQKDLFISSRVKLLYDFGILLGVINVLILIFDGMNFDFYQIMFY